MVAILIRVKIDIGYDHVMFEGQRIERPATFSRHHWMQFWETIKAMNDHDDGRRRWT